MSHPMLPATTLHDRMPMLPQERMNEAQRAAAAELAAGPRGGVKGPFIPLLRSPELMNRLQKVGEYLRFESALPTGVNEFVTLVVAREWTQQFEWAVHLPLAIKGGVAQEAVRSLAEGRRPEAMSADEALCYDFTVELIGRHGVADATFQRMVTRFGEQGLIDLVGLIGYFTTISMVLNVAHTPAQAGSAVEPLRSFPG